MYNNKRKNTRDFRHHFNRKRSKLAYLQRNQIVPIFVFLPKGVPMKPNRLFSLLVVISLTLAACGGRQAPPSARSNERRQASSAPASDIKTVVDGNNAFAFDIYQTLRAQDGNLILSPFSISLALAMTYAGARGETESQMARTLHFDLPQEQLHPAFNALDLALEETANNASADQTPLQLNIANAVWAEQSYNFVQSFLDTTAINYGAGINLADFANDYESVRKEINGWVEDKTEEKIVDLIPSGALNASTKMVLVNAIYFKADWLAQFDANDTRDQPFHLLDGSTVNAPFMNQGMDNIPYAQGDGYQAAELAYAGGTAAMDIVVPDEGKFESFESNLTAAQWNEILGAMQPTSLWLSLPKFTFTKSFSLVDTLSSIGMSDAFDGEKADFSAMTEKKDLFISDVIHKAFVAVDEEGTEAAAATAVIMEAAMARIFNESLIVDRPFIFAIRDIATGQILFVGRVTNPAQ